MTDAAPRTPNTYVFVPGAWHGGWCFRDVARLLRRAGHEVYALTVTGLGERAHLAHPGITLDTHIQDVVGVLDAEELSGAVLIGHSYGGCVISGAAVQRPAAVGTLVYLDAVVLRDGECLFNQLDPAFQAALREDAAANGNGYLLSNHTMEFLGVDPEHASRMQRRLMPHPIGTATQPLHSATPDPAILRVFIDCDSPSIPPLATTKARLRYATGWAVHTLHTGHDPLVTAPQALAELLGRIG